MGVAHGTGHSKAGARIRAATPSHAFRSPRMKNPFDSLWATVAGGLLLTLVLVMLARAMIAGAP